MRITQILCLFAMTCFITSAFAGTVYYVNWSTGDDSYNGLYNEPRTFPNGPKRTIQAGIHASASGDTVVVASGWYFGRGNLNIDLGGRAITLISEKGPNSTTIECSGTELDQHSVFYFHSGEGSNTIVDGFTIDALCANLSDGPEINRCSAIFCVDSSPTIRNCIIIENPILDSSSLTPSSNVEIQSTNLIDEEQKILESETMRTGSKEIGTRPLGGHFFPQLAGRKTTNCAYTDYSSTQHVSYVSTSRDFIKANSPLKEQYSEQLDQDLWVQSNQARGNPQISNIRNTPRGILLSLSGLEGDKNYGVYCAHSVDGEYVLLNIIPGYETCYLDDGDNELEHPESAEIEKRFYKIAELDTSYVVQVNSDLNENTVWVKDKVYIINSNVNVSSLLVIEPGTLLRYTSSGCLRVPSNCVLIADGTPQDRIRFTSNESTPNWGDFFCAVLFENALANSSISYCIVEYAFQGITTIDTRLVNPINHNVIRYCNGGIVEFGIQTTDIINNAIHTCYDDGIFVQTANLQAQNSNATHITIQGNTIDHYQDNGIRIHGSPELEDAPTISLYNNIVSRCNVYGVCLLDGYMLAEIAATGYYANDLYGGSNVNWSFEQIAPVYEYDYPYDNMENGELREDSLAWLCLLPSSEFVKETNGVFAVSQFPWMVGTSCLYDQTIDTDVCSLGYHIRYPEMIAGSSSGISITYPENNTIVSGDVDVSVQNSEGVVEYYMFLDGQFIGLMLGEEDEEENKYCLLETFVYKNGTHRITVLALDANENLYFTEHKVTFDNELTNLKSPDFYEEGVDYKVLGFLHPDVDPLLRVYEGDSIIWTHELTNNTLNVSIPHTVFSIIGMFYDIEVSDMNQPLRNGPEPMNNDYKAWKGMVNVKKDVTTFQVAEWLMTFPSKRLAKKGYNGRITGAIKCAVTHGKRFVILYGRNCSHWNVIFVLHNYPNLDTWYNFSHGNAYVPRTTIQRTNIKLVDGTVYSYNKADLIATGCSTSGYVNLPGRIERNAKTWWQPLHLFNNGKLKYIVMDSCKSARYNDLAQALGMYSADNWALRDQCYWGWENDGCATDVTLYNTWMKEYWKSTEAGKTMEQAVLDATYSSGPSSHPSTNYKFQGMGSHSLRDLP